MNIFWFRRDLRLEDNVGLTNALTGTESVLPIFIFDTDILDELPDDDPRVGFIYDQLARVNDKLLEMGSGLLIKKGQPVDIFQELMSKYPIQQVYANRDYEPYSRERDEKVEKLLSLKGIGFRSFKDQVIFEPHEVLKGDGKPYTVYTPYKNAWLKKYSQIAISPQRPASPQFMAQQELFPSLDDLGFRESIIKVLPYDISDVSNYDQTRDILHLDGTSYLGPHLRFGTVGIRSVVNEIDKAQKGNQVFLSELIWREFFFQILFHYPDVVHRNFKSKYDGIQWRNNEKEFEKWCEGKTGYPMVDAGMRQLNQTGYIHNRARMVVAGFLCKHLLIDWRWGEGYFAKKLLDYELSSNNGNWQWAAGTGCDAAPYFRVFNPTEQVKRFDGDLKYIRKWVPEYDSLDYPVPMVEHKYARQRALDTYKAGIASGQ